LNGEALWTSLGASTLTRPVGKTMSMPPQRDLLVWVMNGPTTKKMKHERPPFSRCVRQAFEARPDLVRRMLANETVEDYTQAETELLDLVLTGRRRQSRRLLAEVGVQIQQFLDEDPAMLLRTLA
jgi:hypothetical protein